MKLFSVLFLSFVFSQVFGQTEPTLQSDTVSTDILKWVDVTRSFGYKPVTGFPDIRDTEGNLKTKREISGDVISWVEDVTRLHYQALQDSAYLFLQQYCSAFDTSETENTAYKQIVNDRLFADFGTDLNTQFNQLPSINPTDPTETELVLKYLFEYFEKAHFKKGVLRLSDFDDDNKTQFPFYNALYQITLLIK